MCLIVVKPKGKEMPSNKDMKRWFNTFPDGVGISYQHRGKVRTIKGAMSIRQMRKLSYKLQASLTDCTIKDIDVVIQFRLAVTGSVCPEYTHPFPVLPDQASLNSLDVYSDMSLAHNGIIAEYNPFYSYGYRYGTANSQTFDINDAQEFIKDYVYPLGRDIFKPVIRNLIQNYTESKFAVLTPNKFLFIGDFIKDGGYYYSNPQYKPLPKALTHHTPAARSNRPANSKELKSWRDFVTPTTNIKGEVNCDFCGQPHPIVYELADGSVVCAGCYTAVQGREPTEEEIYY